MSSTLEQQLSELLNEYCEENKSDTPDFVLAMFLKQSLEAFHNAVRLREDYYGRQATAMYNLDYIDALDEDEMLVNMDDFE